MSDLLPARRVFVTVGSDHHRFDRLVGWVDDWTASRGLGPADVLVQHGPAEPPTSAAGVDFVSHDELLRLMGAADVVVAQGGPMSVVEAREQGRRPIVVPRLSALDEVVDDHQVTFCRRVATQGWIDLVETEAELVAALDRALADPELARVQPDPEHDAAVVSSIARFGRIADQVMAGRSRRSRGGGRPDRPTVLVLGGFGRSGSTLLERALAQTPGVAALGELLHLWERGLDEDQRCGCGLAFGDCPFWQSVGQRAFGGWSELDPRAAIADRRAVVRNGNLLALTTGLVRTGDRLRRDRFVRRVSAIYTAAAAETGAELLVDSSKHPAYAFAVRRADADVRCVLVIRDPRGVAYSWSKIVSRPEITTEQVNMPRYSSGASAARWSLYAVLFEALRLLRVPVLVVRYEDLIAEPRATLQTVLRFGGHAALPADLRHVHADRLELDAHHTVAGNPMRFVVGTVSLRADEEWRQAMPSLQRSIVSAITAPLRRRYGYHDQQRRPVDQDQQAAPLASPTEPQVPPATAG